MNESEYVKIAILENQFEAQIISAVMEDTGIPHIIRSYHDTAYDGLFQAQKGWGEVRAPLDYGKQILEILSDLRAGDQSK
ncbi:Uncharacterized protein dnl_06220 [Desulfonema limicola]|uniref:DUF2007 domain-containing protein n=1 Tax=Desulfonema limicola TaxID=45656 RepID=A0A975B407_9BACT|nr:hypothetical protein [Desulfonema limicola]QTA78400.1 Uncharacterized protein dnl_06220 [Desulfonema limicola]